MRITEVAGIGRSVAWLLRAETLDSIELQASRRRCFGNQPHPPLLPPIGDGGTRLE
jgi:hypothetical protein